MMQGNESKPKTILGDFEIVREIGRGGMGVVYEARQRSLNRRVALKVLSSGLGLSDKAITRFRREAEAAAKLHHTNIVPIYSTGAEHGTHYYAMELVEGPSLDQVIRQLRGEKAPASVANPRIDSSGDSRAPGPLPDWVGETIAFEGSPRPSAGPSHNANQSAAKSNPNLSSSGNTKYFDNVAKMIADVADALHHAHEEGVIHRDIKPSNLLLSPDGRLSLNDFGLARVLEQPGMTMSGEFVGSPLYMSPEQITAGRAPLDHRTDIYSLGATLYELLTLEPPFPGQQRDQVIAQILHKEPTPVRRKNRKVPIDLETICMKALEKDPDRRYQTAGQLAADLRAFVNRFAISARRVGPVGHAVKWVRRNPIISALVVLLAFMAATASLLNYQSTLDRKRFVEEKMRVAEGLILYGDFDGAEKELNDADSIGAPEAWVHLRRGQLAFHRGYSDDAVRHLTDAIRLKPTNVTARAMLACANVWSLNWEEYDANADALASLTPVSAEDYIYVGLARSYSQPEIGIELLSEGISKHRAESTLARAIRAHVRGLFASQRGDPALIEQAQADSEVATQMLPGNSTSLCISLLVNLQAAVIKQGEQRKEALNKASQAENALKVNSDTPLNTGFRVTFLIHPLVQREVEAIQLCQQQDDTGKLSHFAAPYYAWALYREGKLVEALNVAQRREFRKNGLLGYLRALIELEIDKSTSPRMLYNRFRQECPSAFADLVAPSILGIAGEREAADQAWKELADAPGAYAMWKRPWATHLLDYARGSANDGEQLLDYGQPSVTNQAEAYCLIGLRLIADGRFDEAQEQFARGAQVCGICWEGLVCWCLSRKLEANSNWPSDLRNRGDVE